MYQLKRSSVSISFSVTLLLLRHSKQNLGLLMVRCVDYIVLFGYESSINQDESNPNIQAIMGSIPQNGCIWCNGGKVLKRLKTKNALKML